MSTKKLKVTPYHDISSILDLDKNRVDIKIQQPKFEKEFLHPYRGSYFCILLLTKGSVNHMANLEKFDVEENTVVFSSPGIINCWEQPSSNLDGYSLLFTADFFKQNSNNILNINQLPFFQWDAQHFLKIKKTESRSLSKLLKEIDKELKDNKHRNSAVIQSYITILLVLLERIYLKEVDKHKASSKMGQLANEYQCLVSNHFHQNLTVKDYAKMLNVTPNHLNDTVKNFIGKTAGTLIQEMTLLEAKVLLHQTDINVAEIAYHLNFEDPSYFGRFFKKHTKMTPFEYRKDRIENP